MSICDVFHGPSPTAAWTEERLTFDVEDSELTGFVIALLGGVHSGATEAQPIHPFAGRLRIARCDRPPLDSGSSS